MTVLEGDTIFLRKIQRSFVSGAKIFAENLSVRSVRKNTLQTGEALDLDRVS